ncbi:MAG TPA: hypothetical protein VH600_21585 [Burkholderiales bacterium]|jgi:hypothetical protein
MKTQVVHQALSQHELVQLLNWELAAYDKCEGTRFTSIKSIPGPDPAGCNWSYARVKSDHSLDRRERRIVRRVIEQTRREFNLD